METKSVAALTQKIGKCTQFSKRLAILVAVFWCAFRLFCLAALLFRPDTADSLQPMIQGLDDVMKCNIGFYCGNSVAEKGIVNYFQARTGSANAADDSGSNG